MEPVGMVSTLRSSASASVMRITAPLPKAFSICASASSRVFSRSVALPFTLVTVLVDVPFI